MAGRALVFSNPAVIARIRQSFVAYAGDQWYLHRQEDADGKFFWKVAQQGHNKDLPEDSTRQGLYITTADGTFLASDCFRPSVAKFAELMDAGLKRWRTVSADSASSGSESGGLADPRYERVPPKDGMILNVYTRIPLALEPPKDGSGWQVNQAVGRDHLWLTSEEAASLSPKEWRIGAPAPIPASLAMRIARFHLIDSVRGEPSFWNRAHVRKVDIKVRVEDAVKRTLRLDGVAEMATNSGDRGYNCRLQGLLTYDAGARRLKRFDILAWGESWGEGAYTRGAPKGRFPLVVAFSLAGNAPADRVPPQGAREISGYMNP